MLIQFTVFRSVLGSDVSTAECVPFVDLRRV
jgi:hypothetical protein